MQKGQKGRKTRGTCTLETPDQETEEMCFYAVYYPNDAPHNIVNTHAVWEYELAQWDSQPVTYLQNIRAWIKLQNAICWTWSCRTQCAELADLIMVLCCCCRDWEWTSMSSAQLKASLICRNPPKAQFVCTQDARGLSHLSFLKNTFMKIHIQLCSLTGIVCYRCGPIKAAINRQMT